MYLLISILYYIIEILLLNYFGKSLYQMRVCLICLIHKDGGSKINMLYINDDDQIKRTKHSSIANGNQRTKRFRCYKE